MDQKKEYRGLMLRIGAAVLLNFVLLIFLPYAADFLNESIGHRVIQSISKYGIPYVRVRNAFESILFGVSYLLAFLLPAAFFGLFSRKRGKEEMRLSVRLSGQTPLAIIAALGLIVGLSYLNGMLVGPIDYWGESGEPLDEPYMILLAFFTEALIPGLCEEFLFRGVVLSNMLPYGRTAAVIGSAAAFALMHGNPAQYLYAFGAGVILGVVYLESGSIWPGTLIHIFNNLFSLAEHAMMDMGCSDLWMNLLMLTVLLASCVCTVVLILIRKGKVFTDPVSAAEPTYSATLDRRTLVRGFFSPTMIVFTVLSLSEALIRTIDAMIY